MLHMFKTNFDVMNNWPIKSVEISSNVKTKTLDVKRKFPRLLHKTNFSFRMKANVS